MLQAPHAHGASQDMRRSAFALIQRSHVFVRGVVERILISTCCQHAEHELYFLLQLGQFSELVVAFSFQDIRKSQECRFLAAWIFLYLMLESQELACYWSSVCRFFIIIRQSRQFSYMYSLVIVSAIIPARHQFLSSFECHDV